MIINGVKGGLYIYIYIYVKAYKINIYYLIYLKLIDLYTIYFFVSEN